MDELTRLRGIETAARHLRSQLSVGGVSYNEAKYDAEQALDAALAVPKHERVAPPPREWKPGDRVTVGGYSFLRAAVRGKTGTVVSVKPNPYGNRGGFAVVIKFPHLAEPVECHSADLSEERDVDFDEIFNRKGPCF